jgi:hypothetical protein
MPTSADKIVEYCLSIAKEFQSRMTRMQVFVRHNLTSGTANETMLREFLARHAPGYVNVGQGFICDPTEGNQVSKQCDILIYDQIHYPVVYSDGSIKVIWPRSARMVIEVKTNFNKSDITTSIENIASARQFNSQLTGIIFAFRSPGLKTVIKHLQNYPHYIPPEHRPLAFLLLDKGIIIHCWGWSRSQESESNPDADFATFEVRRGKRDKSAVVVTCLLLLFFGVVQRGFYEADSINMLLDVFQKYTEKVGQDIHVGQSSQQYAKPAV